MDKQPVTLLRQVRRKIRLKHYSIRMEAAFAGWIERFILFFSRWTRLNADSHADGFEGEL